jgi:hypothetical protein
MRILCIKAESNRTKSDALARVLLLHKADMNKMKYIAAVLIAITGMGLQQAQAHLLDPFEFTLADPLGDPASELSYLQNNGGGSYQPTFLPATSQFLFKQNSNGSSEGSFGQYFTISISGHTATVSWNLAGSGMTLDGVLIKDGSGPGGNSHLYSFYGVSADEITDGSGTVSFDSRNISHISFFGSPGGNGVPDGGTTVMLLGAALGALGMARRFLMT